MAQRRLIPLAEQLEDVRALREVVVSRLRAWRLFPHESANPKELAPVGRRPARVEPALARFEPLLGLLAGVRLRPAPRRRRGRPGSRRSGARREPRASASAIATASS